MHVNIHTVHHRATGQAQGKVLGVSPESAAMKSRSRTVPSAAPGPLNAKRRASVSCSCSLSPLSARSLLALLEECNPDPSNHRASYRLGRQAGVGEGQVEDVAGGGAAVGRVVAPLVVEHQPAPLLVRAYLGISSPVALHGQRRTTLRGDADAEMRNLSATISLPS